MNQTMIKFLKGYIMGNFIENSRNQGLFLTVDLDRQLIPGSLEYTIDDLVENQLDISELINSFNNDLSGAPAYHPKDILKVLFFAHARGISSLRKIERLCRENIIFITLSGDLRPDHATIARFITRLETSIESLFNQLLLYCDSLGLLAGTELAIDGCKISSNAAKESSGTFSELEKKQLKYQETASLLLTKSKNAVENEQAHLEERSLVYEQKVQRIKNFLETSEKRIGARNKEVKSNITDNESAKLKSGHGVIQGYYALASVDSKHQIITGSMAVGTQNEGKYLKDLIDASKAILPNRITSETTILADTGYFSEANCKYLFSSGQKAVIPDIHFRQRDPLFHRDQEGKNRNPRGQSRVRFKPEDFHYNKETDRYICPAGKSLKPDGRTNNHGHKGKRYVKEGHDCTKCYLKAKCTNKNGKRRYLFIVEVPREMTYSNRMIDIIDSYEGRQKYSKRMGIVEPVFGNITSAKRLNRINYRGSKKVNAIWTLYCLIHNLEKIHNYGKK